MPAVANKLGVDVIVCCPDFRCFVALANDVELPVAPTDQVRNPQVHGKEHH
jgi:hypothetical protein